MLEFAIEMCHIQRRAGRGFLFEHQLPATSREMESLKKLANMPEVHKSVFDMCRFGMTAEDGEGEGLVRKSTQILTNVKAIADILSVRCGAGHRHVHLISGKAKAAQVYPPKMCEGIIKGLRLWISQSEDARSRQILEFSREDLCDLAEAKSVESGDYLDDIKGDHLDSALAKIARGEEIQVFKERRVYEPVPRASIPPGRESLVCDGWRPAKGQRWRQR